MQIRYSYKLRPSKMQREVMNSWLVTLRKHRNYALRQRTDGYQTNNQNVIESINFSYGAYSDLKTREIWNSWCPLTCPVLKHGVIPEGIELTKKSKDVLKWGNVSDIQMKATTRLRTVSKKFKKIDSDVLQRNVSRLDTAFDNFFKHDYKYPQFKNKANFKSFEYKPNRVKVRGKSKLYFPGIGEMRYFNSRPFPELGQMRTVTVIKDVEDWYVSILFKTPEELPKPKAIEDCQSNVCYDLGINKLASLTDGCHIENPKFNTNKRHKRRLRIRQRRVNRKVKGSKNRQKAGIKVAKLHQKVRNRRDDYQWKAAHKIVCTAESIGREQLNISNMKKRCKPKRAKGRFMPNGQSQKRSLNRSISDASWGLLNQKVDWIAAKQGKPVAEYEPSYTSQKCSQCGHISKDNRDGEKFICTACGHIDHADTQAARNGQKRLNLKFVSTRHKNLPGDSGEVTPKIIEARHDTARKSKRYQSGNSSEEKLVQLSLFDSDELAV